MENSVSIRRLEKIKEEGFFTRDLSFEEFIEGLCKRFAKIHGEILPINNYEYIIKKMEEKNIL